MFKETCNLYALPSLYSESDPNEISLTSHILSAVSQNHEILDFNYNWLQLDANFKLYFFIYFKRFYDNLSAFRSVYTFVK